METELDEAHPQRSNDTPRTSALDPGFIVRIQYASYLFLCFLLCVLLRGVSKDLFGGSSALSVGCALLSRAGGEMTATVNVICTESYIVYRISFALVVFFGIHFGCVSDLTCCIEARSRAELQTRFFCVRTLLLILLIGLTLLIPNHFFLVYAKVTLVASGLFLLIQLVLLVDFAYTWSEIWSRREAAKWKLYLLLIAFGGYGGGLVCTILSFVFFVPHADCNTNAVIISCVLIAAVVYTAVCVWVPHGSIVPSAVVYCYTSFVTLISLYGTTDGYCNSLASTGRQSVGVMVASATVSAVALAYAVVSSGGSHQAMQIEEDPLQGDADEAGHLASYCYFYLILMLGSAYLAMLATDWQLAGAEQGSTPMAVWVRLATVAGTVLLYMWSLLAPYFCCRHRDFGYDIPDEW